MKKVKLMIPFFLMPILTGCVAENASRTGQMDHKYMKAILMFIRSFSFPVLAFGIGMLCLAIKDGEANSKVRAIKIIGTSFLMFSLLSFAETFGFC